MASFLIISHAENYANQSSRTALKFAQAVIAQGHTLEAIFFYQQGVSMANSKADIPSDELDNREAFIELNQQHKVPLLICVTAAEKRGLLADDCDSHFTVAGLAEMATISATVDRVIQFK